jgi:hypothetical protein
MRLFRRFLRAAQSNHVYHACPHCGEDKLPSFWNEPSWIEFARAAKNAAGLAGQVMHPTQSPLFWWRAVNGWIACTFDDDNYLDGEVVKCESSQGFGVECPHCRAVIKLMTKSLRG